MLMELAVQSTFGDAEVLCHLLAPPLVLYEGSDDYPSLVFNDR